jgi:hypothetical protein
MADNKLTPTLEAFSSFSLLPRDWHASKIKLRDITRSFHLPSLSLGWKRKRAKCVKRNAALKARSHYKDLNEWPGFLWCWDFYFKLCYRKYVMKELHDAGGSKHIFDGTYQEPSLGQTLLLPSIFLSTCTGQKRGRIYFNTSVVTFLHKLKTFNKTELFLSIRCACKQSEKKNNCHADHA